MTLPSETVAVADSGKMTLGSAGINGACVRMLLWDGLHVRRDLPYAGPPAKVTLLYISYFALSSSSSPSSFVGFRSKCC